MSLMELLQQYYWLIIIAYLAGFFAILAYFLTKNRNKILVRIRTVPEKEVWATPDTMHNRITIMQDKHKWTFKYSSKSLIPKRGFLKSFYVLEVHPNAGRAIEFNMDGDEMKEPRLTRQEAREINFLEGFKARYKEVGKRETNILLVIVIIIGIAGIIVPILTQKGILRI
jgi:hypothetical protein